MLYATFAGDVVRTAHSLNVPPAAVLMMADEEQWNDKLKSIIDLRQSAKPGDWERAINRAFNFVIAHQLRLLLDRALRKFRDMNDQELERTLIEEWFDKDGNKRQKPSGKVFADFAAAMEKAQSMTYHALSDTVQDRNRRKEQASEEDSSSDMHAQISARMQEVATSQSPRAVLFDAQVEKGQHIAADARDQQELVAKKEKIVRPRWKEAVREAKETFNSDPRMLDR